MCGLGGDGMDVVSTVLDIFRVLAGHKSIFGVVRPGSRVFL